MRTESNRLQLAGVLSAVLAATMIVAASCGLWVHNLYQDPVEVAQLWRAYDAITLFLVTPLLVLALALARRRGMVPAQVLWFAMLCYGVYNYTAFVFGAALNAMFLVHVLALVLSIAALVTLLLGMDPAAIRRRFADRTPVRSVAVVLVLITVGLAGI